MGETRAEEVAREIAAEERRARLLLAEIERRGAEGRKKAYVPHRPHRKQGEFLASTEKEVLYGGEAGSGKSDAVLMAALQYVHVPGYAALVLRRKYSDLALPGAVMDRADEWLRPTDAVWNKETKTWRFPSGATLSFGFCDRENDRYRYQGAELQFLSVDELTQWPERWYTYLLSRLRKTDGLDVPLRAWSTANPGGVGHKWVKRRFVDPDGVGKYIHATRADNPSLDAASYESSLDLLDSLTKRQLKHGEWVNDETGLVYAGFLEERNVVAEAPRCDSHVLAIDYGYKDDCAFVLYGWKKGDRRVWVLEAEKYDHMIPSDAAEVALSYSRRLQVDRIVGDMGGLGKGYAEEARARFGVPIEAAEKSNKRGYISLFNGALERGEVLVVKSAAAELTKEWAELPWDEGRERESEGFANHLADAALYGWRACFAFTEDTDAPKPRDEEAEIWGDDEAQQSRWQKTLSDGAALH